MTDHIKTIREALDTYHPGYLRGHAALDSLEAELATLRARLAPADSLTCPHCDEAVTENEGVEGPHGNLWHYRCLEAWRETDD